MKYQFRSIAATAALVAFASAPVFAQVTFREVPVQNLVITSWSGDGRVGVGVFVATQSGTAAEGYRWTAEGGAENIGGNHLYGIMISRDGKTIVGHILNSEGMTESAIWQGGKNWRPLGRFPGQAPDVETKILNLATGVSADGSVIVGYGKKGSSTGYAFRWDAQNGMVDLGSFWGEDSQARAVSADGNTIVGWNYNRKTPYPRDGRQGVIFWEGMERLLHPFGWAGEASATNGVGSIIAGVFNPQDSYSNFTAPTTYRYTAWDGKFEDLGAVSSGNIAIDFQEYTSRPMAMSDNGEVIGGTTGQVVTKGAMMWTRVTGMVRLRDWLTSQGVTSHQGWLLLETNYVSPDGKFIAGVGYKPQPGLGDVGGSWVVTLR